MRETFRNRDSRLYRTRMPMQGSQGKDMPKPSRSISFPRSEIRAIPIEEALRRRNEFRKADYLILEEYTRKQKSKKVASSFKHPKGSSSKHPTKHPKGS